MCGEEDARWRLAKAARESDVILIEGVMGLFDGKPSAADIAVRFRVPVLALIDAGAMAQTFGAVAHGLATYRPGLPFAGVRRRRRWWWKWRWRRRRSRNKEGRRSRRGFSSLSGAT